jgi:hypothetical protein
VENFAFIDPTMPVKIVYELFILAMLGKALLHHESKDLQNFKFCELIKS